MSKHFVRDLETLERQVLSQASIVEEMIQKACLAIREMRPELVSDVMQHETIVDEQEVQIEEECLKILALHQPVAINLRRVVTILKINNDLERIADLAVNVAERASSLSGHAGLLVPETFDRMVEVTVAMVQAALDALVSMDVETAGAVRMRDEEVDALNREVIEQVQQVMKTQPELVEAAMYLFSASRYVERIADHATNIAEDVIYLVDGEIARHKHDLDAVVQ